MDLNNFDSANAERSRYVLTSPRSLQSCARLGIRPVQLLIKSLNELIAERNGLPVEAVRVMHESYEKERKKLLGMCQKERERIIQEEVNRWPSGDCQLSGPRVTPGTKQTDPPVERPNGSIKYAELCVKSKPASRSTCSAATHTRKKTQKAVCSISLGDLRCSPSTETRVERLTKDIKKEMHVTVSERDRKIAALMLVKHQQEQALLKLSHHEELEREEARRQEEARQARAETERRRKLRRSVQHWEKELEVRRRLRERRDAERAGQLKQEVLVQEERWRRLREEVEAQHREKREALQREAEERKRCQERLRRKNEEVKESRLERERQVAAKKEQRAGRWRASAERWRRARLKEGNRRETLRHILLRQHVDRHQEEEETRTRSAVERRLQRFSEERARLAQERLLGLQERSARQQEQVQRARLRAELQDVQDLAYKQVLVQLGQRRADRASAHASAQSRERAEQARRRNEHRRLCHQLLRQRMEEEEEEARQAGQCRASLKEERRQALRREREQVREEGQRLARASFHLRERVRQQTHSRTFDRMALEAQLSASMSCLKL